MGFKLTKDEWLDLWNALDPDKSGNLSVKEFQEALDAVAGLPDDEYLPEVEAEVTWEDFAALVILRGLRQKIHDKGTTVTHWFHEELGGNKTGFATPKKLRKKLKDFGFEFQEGDFRDIMWLDNPEG